MRRKKTITIILVTILGIIIWNHLPYKYYNDNAVNYATDNVANQSRCMCAWYTMRALQEGGCPIGIAPAYAYNKILPQIGFAEVTIANYIPQRGDISVLPSNTYSSFGHIAIYNGKYWISDFKQKSIYPSMSFKTVGKYRVYRISDGWHWKHVWISPKEWLEWVQAVKKGWKKIKI